MCIDLACIQQLLQELGQAHVYVACAGLKRQPQCLISHCGQQALQLGDSIVGTLDAALNPGIN